MRKLTLKVDNPLYEHENTKYGYGFSDTNEVILTINNYIDCEENLGLFNLKGKTLENRKVLVLPNFLQPIVFKVAQEIESKLIEMTPQEIEEGKEKVLDINLKKIMSECDVLFDETCKFSAEQGEAVAQEVVDKYLDCREFDKHPLDKTLKKAGFTKVYSDRGYRVKKEYSIHIGLDYSITLAYIRYMAVDKDKVILNFNTYSLPYQVFTNLDKILEN